MYHKLISREEKRMASKAKMFNREAANPENKPEEILKTLALRQGQKIADIGAGGGYFSLRFAEAVGKQGVVYAVDTDLGKIEFIRKSVADKGLGNVQVVLPGKESLTLPEKIDLIFLRNVYHHIANRVEYFAKLRESLKPDGRIAIIEHDGGGRFSFHRIFERRVTRETIVKEMTKAGCSIAESIDFLQEQSFTIFSRTPLQKRGKNCPEPWKRKNMTIPIDKLLFGRQLSQTVTKRSHKRRKTEVHSSNEGSNDKFEFF
jgi:predicted methyltransferase